MTSEGRTREPAKVRFCSCVYESIKPGALVYMKPRVDGLPQSLTTNAAESDPKHREPVGEISGAAFKLNASGEAILKVLA